jgi:SurA-like N-terminal domain
VSPSKRKRPTKGQGSKGGASARPGGLAPLQRLGLLAFGTVLVLLFVGFAIAEGIGHPSVPSGDVALVEDVPSDIGHVSQADFDKAFLQTASRGGLKAPPKPGEPQYKDVRDAAMGDILDAIWIQGEADEMGITVTQRQIANELVQIKKQNFKTEAEYKKFLKTSHFTQADVDERVKLQLLSTQIQQQISDNTPKPSSSEIENYYEAAKATQFTTPAVPASKGKKAQPEKVQSLDEVRSQIESQLTQQAQQDAFSTFVANYGSKWQSRTFCASGYVIERCANFKGDGHPADAPPACYEANPKGGLPDACPAPVKQLAPALPGTVNVLAPKGQQLPQRPQPAGLKATPAAAPTGLPGAIPGATP